MAPTGVWSRISCASPTSTASPSLVAVPVVNGLEPVDVEQNDGEGLVGLLSRHDHRGEPLDQVTPVVQPGQRIPAGQLGQVSP